MLLIKKTQPLLFKTTQPKILALINSLTGIVEDKNPRPILSNLFLEKKDNELICISSDGDIQIKNSIALDEDATDTANFSTTINARKIQNIISALEASKEIQLKQQNEKIQIHSGKSRFSILTLSAENYPLMQSENFGTVIEVQQKAFKDLISKVYFSMAVKDIRHYLNGILMLVEEDNFSMVATDAHRMAYGCIQLENKYPAQQFLLPRKTAQELQKHLHDKDGELLKIFISPTQVKFIINQVEITSKLIDGKFPDYKTVMPSSQKNLFIINREELLAKMREIRSLTSEKFNGVQIKLEENLLTLSHKNSDQEEAEVVLDIEYSQDLIEIGFNTQYLFDVLTHLSNEKLILQFDSNDAPILFTVPDVPNYRYVVMPMRI